MRLGGAVDNGLVVAKHGALLPYGYTKIASSLLLLVTTNYQKGMNELLRTKAFLSIWAVLILPPIIITAVPFSNKAMMESTRQMCCSGAD